MKIRHSLAAFALALPVVTLAAQPGSYKETNFSGVCSSGDAPTKWNDAIKFEGKSLEIYVTSDKSDKERELLDVINNSAKFKKSFDITTPSKEQYTVKYNLNYDLSNSTFIGFKGTVETFIKSKKVNTCQVSAQYYPDSNNALSTYSNPVIR